MAVNSILSVSQAINGGSPINNASMTQSTDIGTPLSIVIPKNTTAMEIDIASTAAQLKQLTMAAVWASGIAGSDVTIKTNSSSAPDQTWTLKPNKVSNWDADSAFSNPITTTITKIYAYNPSTTDDCTLQMGLVRDITP